MRRSTLGICMVLVAVVVWGLQENEPRPGSSGTAANIAPITAAVAKQATTQGEFAITAVGGSLTSPFGRGQPPAVPTMEERIGERKKHMNSAGIATPQTYFHMSLVELRKRAEKKDIFALLQLGVQYQYERNILELDDDYDISQESAVESKKYFTDAFAAGHIRSAGILSKLNAADGNKIEAYAWHILSKELWDNSDLDWANKEFSGLTQQEQLQAESRASELSILANHRFSVISSPE